jgi:hypothetical protein
MAGVGSDGAELRFAQTNRKTAPNAPRSPDHAL